MGMMTGCRCGKCGFEFNASTGIGFFYPQQHQEIVEKVKRGEYGEEIRQFLLEHPDGEIGCETIVVQCEKCNELMETPDLTMYVPKEDENSHTDESNAEKIKFKWELEEDYIVWKSFAHKCIKCGGHAKAVPAFSGDCDDLEDCYVPCPGCGERIQVMVTGCWD